MTDTFEDRNKRLDDFSDWLENHEFTTEDMLAVLCAQCINNKSNIDTRMLVSGMEFKIDIKLQGFHKKD